MSDNGGEAPNHFFFIGSVIAWPLAPCDKLDAEAAPFVFSAFSLLATLFPFI